MRCAPGRSVNPAPRPRGILPHSIPPVATPERDAIVAALREDHGNRVVAAGHFGVSRSSLYRKLRTYNITA